MIVCWFCYSRDKYRFRYDHILPAPCAVSPEQPTCWICRGSDSEREEFLPITVYPEPDDPMTEELIYMAERDVPVWEQGRVPPKSEGALAIQIRLRLEKNRARSAQLDRTDIEQHTRDCRDPAHRARYARAHEQQGGQS